MEEKIVRLNEDEKAVLLKALKDLHHANGQLYGWVERDELTEDMSKILPSLIESHFSEIAKVVDYESHLLAEKEKRHEAIRNANMRIRELEEKLGSNKPVDGIKEQLHHLWKTVQSWWNTEGFHHVSEECFYPYGGLKVEFHFMLDHYRSYSKTPETDKRNKNEHIQFLRDKGFEFADFERDRSEKLHLIDNPHNRKLLTSMLRGRFPSIEIHKWGNHSSRSNPDTFLIWNIDASIVNLGDI